MNIITQTLANIGRVIEKAVTFTAESVYNAGKYGWDSPREIKKMSDTKRAEEAHQFLYQVIFYHKDEARLNAIEKLRKEYPEEYNANLKRINQDNLRLNIPQMNPVVIESI